MSVVRGRKGGEWEGLAQPLACGQLKPGQRQSQWFKADGGRLMWILDFGKIKPDYMDEAAPADDLLGKRRGIVMRDATMRWRLSLPRPSRRGAHGIAMHCLTAHS
ncbi:hypothetical protein E2C01_063822 [Portunus trituberculatus]|uniref:Uncharacterized protein n=1 Tax=Portunus trituberculatus TaxID=210409 RepID=A0A5B7HEQ3_PORTR|nr:hypothetical protein [Portunus trituberculatus]